MRKLIGLMMVMVLSSLVLASSCNQDQGPSQVEDPKLQRAKEKFDEGRRLFLTCDPNNYAKALQLFDEAILNKDDYAEAMAAWVETLSMWTGFQLSEEGYQNAYMRAQRAWRLAPEKDITWRAGADLFRHHYNQEKKTYDTEYALQLIERALAINPHSAENLFVKGSIYLATDPNQAIEILEQAKQENPNLGKVYFNLATAHQSVANNLMKDAQNDPEKVKAVQEKVQEHYQKAIENYQTYQKLVPGDLGGYAGLGLVYFQMGKNDLAKEAFEKTVSVNPSPDPSQNQWRSVAYYHLSRMAYDAKDFQKLKIYSEKELQIEPNNVVAIKQMMLACSQLDDQECFDQYKAKLDQAIEKMEKAKSEAQAGSTAEPGVKAGSTGEDAPK